MTFFDTISMWRPDPRVVDHDRARVDRIHRLTGTEPKRILELGAGSATTAVATALAGHHVTAIEVSPVRSAQARRIIGEQGCGVQLRFVEADIRTVQLSETYDLVTYWDGFGFGTDEDQSDLLDRVSAWLAPGGAMITDVYAPWRWAAIAGQTCEEGNFTNFNDFDWVGSRYVDTWWPTGDPDAAVTQSARCYAPADFVRLVEASGWTAVRLEVDGLCLHPAPDEGAAARLREAWDYTALLEPSVSRAGGGGR